MKRQKNSKHSKKEKEVENDHSNGKTAKQVRQLRDSRPERIMLPMPRGISHKGNGSQKEKANTEFTRKRDIYIRANIRANCA